MSGGDRPSAIVVGAGVFGASTAHQLAADGWRVTLIDQDEPGNERATSSSRSRVIRYGHGHDAWYTRLAWRARTLWRQLEQETGTPLLVESGMVWFAQGQTYEPFVAGTEATLRAEGIPVERLTPAEVAGLFPAGGIDVGDLAYGVLEPAAGALHARRAVTLLAGLAVSKGAQLRRGAARPAGEPRGSAVALDGEVLRADRVVWACGPWLPRLFPGLVELRVGRVEYWYYRAPPGWTMPPLPVWYDFGSNYYGIFALDEHGLKIAPDAAGEELDPQRGSRELRYQGEPAARAFLERRFPGLARAGLRLCGGRVCQYELTPDHHFILAPLPGVPGAWVLGGGSGHGFKHGPALGEYVARLLTGEEQPLDRFGLEVPRTPVTLDATSAGTTDFR
jgi:glycine/D-amino acid oxidase-like deaminating enzyme